MIIEAVADVALLGAACYLGFLLDRRARGTRLWFPIVMMFSAVGLYSGAAVGSDAARWAGASPVDDQLYRVAQIGQGLVIAALVHLVSVYPRNLKSRWVRAGVPATYFVGMAFSLLSPTNLMFEIVPAENRGIPGVHGPRYWPVLSVLLAALVAAVGWCGYLILRGRTPLERRGAAGLGATIAIPMAVFALSAATGGGAMGPLNPVTVFYAAGVVIIAAVTLKGAIEPPIQSTFRGLVESVDEAVIVMDRQGRLASANRSAHQLLGFDAPESAFEPLDLVLAGRLGRKEDLDHVLMTAKGVVRGRIESHEGVIENIGADHLTYRWRVFPLGRRDSNGEVKAALIMLRDETGRFALEKSTAQSRDVLDLVIRMLGHDLKAPLTVVQGYIDLDKMRLDGSSDAATAGKVKADLDKMGEAVVGMHMMMGNARALSRLAATGGDGLEWVEVDLTKLVGQALDLLAPVAATRQIRIERHVEPGVHLKAVPGFDSVPRNLVDNAIKYTPPGGTVTVTLAKAGASVRLKVADTGQGIPPEKKGNLFMKFERLGAERGPTEGHGLGLSIVAKLVELSKGTIEAAEREDGKSGTVFIVDLPVS